ncbi:hypothetical protein FRC04_010137 [Tulasnella sp. 424]|nr:hypothetical protein FRC04_010137 [Tulasnella sp. 424]KAG8972544.1 hypothetical protein FRC05_009777 [Tulasnella sp. 425]
MPSTTYSITTRIPSDESGPLLALKVTHCIDVVHATDVPLALASFPQRFVVTHGGHVEISLHGRHQSVIPVDVLSKSGGLLEFVRALTENKSTLSLEDISDVYNDDGILKRMRYINIRSLDLIQSLVTVRVTPSGPLADAITGESLPELKLTGIRVEFIWGSKRSNRAGIEGGSADPFSSKTILLPYHRQWDIAIEKVLVNHMLRQRTRYPYVFGQWKANLTSENNLYYNIANSLCQIYLRSPNREFKKRGKKLFQRLLENSESRSDASWDKLLNLQTPSGQAIFTQEELDRGRSRTRNDDLEDDIDAEECFKRLISKSLSALYAAGVRSGKRDFALNTVNPVSSGFDKPERDFSDGGNEDEGKLTDILEPDVPSSDTAMDETNSDDLWTPVPGNHFMSSDNRDDHSPTNSSRQLRDEFSPLDEDEAPRSTQSSDFEAMHDDFFFDYEPQLHETANDDSPSNQGDSDLELLPWRPQVSDSPVRSNATTPLDLLVDDPASGLEWSSIQLDEGFRVAEDDSDDLDMLDLGSPLPIPHPPLPPQSFLGAADEHPTFLEEDLLLLSPASYRSKASLDDFEIEML